jgi:hypothetical protein
VAISVTIETRLLPCAVTLATGGMAAAGRHRRRRQRHLCRRTVRLHRPPPRQGHRPGRRRPLHHDSRRQQVPRLWRSADLRKRESFVQKRTFPLDHRLAPAVRPQAHYHDLGLDFYASRTSRDRKIRTYLQGLQALGVTVAITADEQAA